MISNFIWNNLGKIILVLAALMFFLIGWVVFDTYDYKKNCEEKGGIAVDGDFEMYCIKAEIIF